MSITRISTFRNVRTRLYRPSAGVWCAGWMKHLTPESARVRFNAFVLLKEGERLVGECYGDGSLVRFSCLVEAQMGQDVALRIDSTLTYVPSTEAIRIQVETFEATLLDATRSVRFLAMDASPMSLGGIAEGGFTPGAEITIMASTQDGEIEAQARVENCRADYGQEGHYRLGLTLLEMRRLDAARWARLVEEWAQS